MDEYGPYRDAWQPDNTTELRYGCLRIQDGAHLLTSPTRIDNPGLYILNDSAHISVGLTDVWIDPATGYIMVDTDGIWNGTAIVGLDETATTNRFLAGPSGGNTYIKLRCSDENGSVNLADQATYTAFASNLLNLWLFFASPGVRGVGGPSLYDRMAALESRVAALESGLPI